MNREDGTPQALLRLPVGQAGGGAARYGAAMHFYQNGLIRADLLEIYRMCSKFDHDDPIRVAQYEGVVVPAFVHKTLAEGHA